MHSFIIDRIVKVFLRVDIELFWIKRCDVLSVKNFKLFEALAPSF
jgi:hypothetical protein